MYFAWTVHCHLLVINIFSCVKGDAVLSRHTGIDIKELQLVGHIAKTHSGEVSGDMQAHMSWMVSQEIVMSAASEVRGEQLHVK